MGDGLSEGVGEGEGLGDGVGESRGSGVGVADVEVEADVREVVVDGLRVVVVLLDGGGGGGVGRPDWPAWPA